MDEAARAELESRVRGSCESGDHDGAATAAIRGYGREVFGSLLAMQRSEEEASEIFSPADPRVVVWTGIGVVVAGAAAGTYALTRSEPEPTRPATDGGGLGWSLRVP